MAILNRRWRYPSLIMAFSGGLTACPPSDDVTVVDVPPELTATAGEVQMVEVGQEVTFDATGTIGAVSFEWAFGDGETSQEADSPIATHIFSNPGHLVATVTATAEDGRTDTEAVGITVVHPLAATPPRFASTIAQSNGLAFAVMRDFDLVAVVDLASKTVIEHLDTCGHPTTLSVADDVLAIACTDDALDLFDVSASPTIEHIRTVETPRASAPFGVVVAEGAAWLTFQGTGQVAAIDIESGLPQIQPVGTDLRGIAWDGTDIWVTQHRSPDDGGVVSRLTDGGVDTFTLAMAPGPDSDTDARGVPTYLQQIAIGPDGKAAFIGGLNANIERGLFRDGQTPTHETTVRATVRQLSLEGGSAGVEGERFRYDERGLASAVAFSSRGDWVYATMLGAQTVDVVDAWTGQAGAGYHDVGEGPDGLFVTDDDTEVWVNASFSRAISVISTANDVEGAGSVTDTIDLLPGGGEVLDAEVLRGKQVFYASVDPRMTASGYVSCASCHLDGDHDGRTWDFTDRGEGLRNTISLLGRGGVAPLHWSANFDEVQDFENDIRGPFQGTGFLDDADWTETLDTLGESKAGRSADLDALAAYVESLTEFPRSPWRNPDGTLSADAQAGKQIFESAQTGCADCHSGPDLTDSAFTVPGTPLLHDVGTITEGSGQRLGDTLTGLDTPSLRGMWATAPYLHDGSAETPGQVLRTYNQSDEHGVTSSLSDDQVSQLATYLLSLE